MKKRHFWMVSVAAFAAVTAVAAPASASAEHEIAFWGMNEAPGSSTMRDGSGHGFNGRIGRDIGVGLRTDDGYGYRFDRLEPDTPPTRPGHLAVVPDDAELDPGSRDYAVTVRLRTREHFGNIIQKGQATVSGGSYKIQIPNGKVQCWFRGTSTALLVTAPRAINDGRWHTVRCERTDDGVFLTIDGRTVAGRYGWTGAIANSWPVAIGGKTDCDQVDVGCDYYAGDIDYIAIEVDQHAW
ncbi:laminin G domain-containing protein [Actinoplanes sp. NPDC048988]|uniref:laminin G domain-containing protein n=1 Tax=Actinoplanes sp. NPDC048988 TaxID=3363901 RepID=UPI00371021AA